jgi:hypothetical protein
MEFKIPRFLVCLIFLTLEVWAQDKTRELNIDLSEYCEDQKIIDESAAALNACVPSNAPDGLEKVSDQLSAMKPFLMIQESPQEAKKRTCQSVQNLVDLKAQPVEMKINDDEGNPWKIRLHFGFTRTNIRPTDVTIKSSLVNTTIKGFEFSERTSAEHYDPRTWEHLQDAARWIDEPSNTFTLSIENKKNAFYLTAFHPKFLKTHYQMTETAPDGTESVTYVPASQHLSNGTPLSYGSIPDGQAGIEIQNTHLLMNYQIGYGRKFTVFDSKKAGKLTYAPRVDAGVTIGGARSIYIVKNESWIEHKDPMGVQGFNASLGHRLEYQRGKVSVFADQKYTKSKMEHSFLDGTASYDLDYSTVTLGVAVDVFTPKKKKDLKKEKESKAAQSP